MYAHRKNVDKYFCNVSAFNFCLVGDLSLERARELATTYIGSLPSVKPSGLPVIHPLDFSAKAPDIRRSFTANIEGDVGEVEMTWISDSKLTNREKAALQIWRGNTGKQVLRCAQRERAGYLYCGCQGRGKSLSPGGGSGERSFLHFKKQG